MNLTLDTFRKYFWNIAVVVAVLITLLIGISFMLQIRESSRVIFGKLPKTQVQGEVFSGEFEFKLEGEEVPGRAKLPRLIISEGSLEKAKFLAKVLRVNGKATSRKDITGSTYVIISDKRGSLTYNIGDGSWQYSGEFASKNPKSISTVAEAEGSAKGVLNRLNIGSELKLISTVFYETFGVELGVTENVKKADVFVFEYTGTYSDKNIYQIPFRTTALVEVKKNGLVSRILYKPVSVVEDEVGDYPIINLGGIKKRVERGEGVAPIIGHRGDIANPSEVEKIIITKIELSYLIDTNSNLLVPFWVLRGRPEGESGNKEVTVLVNAVVDKYLKD